MKSLSLLFLFSILFIAGCAETTDNTPVENFNPYGSYIRMEKPQEEQPQEHGRRKDKFRG